MNHNLTVTRGILFFAVVKFLLNVKKINLKKI